MTEWDKLHEIGDQVWPPPFESLVSTAGKRTRRAGTVAIAATLALVAGVGIGLAAGNDDGSGAIQPITTDESPLPDGSLALPANDAGEGFATLDAGRYRVPLNGTLAFEVDLAAKTYSHSDGFYLASGEIILNVTLADDQYGVPTDPCHEQANKTVGPTVDDLVKAIRNRPVYQVSRPRPIELDGASGQYLEVRIPAGYDASKCQEKGVGLPKPGGIGSDEFNWAPGYYSQWRILDFNGQRVVVSQSCAPCEANAPQRMTKTARSITFTPTS